MAAYYNGSNLTELQFMLLCWIIDAASSIYFKDYKLKSELNLFLEIKVSLLLKFFGELLIPKWRFCSFALKASSSCLKADGELSIY